MTGSPERRRVIRSQLNRKSAIIPGPNGTLRSTRSQRKILSADSADFADFQEIELFVSIRAYHLGAQRPRSHGGIVAINQSFDAGLKPDLTKIKKVAEP